MAPAGALGRALGHTNLGDALTETAAPSEAVVTRAGGGGRLVK
jgi:hypothetical protein